MKTLSLITAASVIGAISGLGLVYLTLSYGGDRLVSF